MGFLLGRFFHRLMGFLLGSKFRVMMGFGCEEGRFGGINDGRGSHGVGLKMGV